MGKLWNGSFVRFNCFFISVQIYNLETGVVKYLDDYYWDILKPMDVKSSQKVG